MDPKQITFSTEVEFESNSDATSNKNTIEVSNSTTNQNQLDDIKKVATHDYRLPSSVNFIALRESLLSEAPFVSKSNKMFWRRMVDDYHYQNLLSCGFRHVLSCISDSGNVSIDKLLDMADSPFTSIMATNISEMIYSMRLRDRDVFFAKLPEITSFMIIEALHTSTPKHYRVYNSVRFREILLDWTSELLSGIRLSNVKAGREWIFNSALESNIMTTSSIPVILPNISAKQTAASSLYCVEHSPLVRQYMGLKPDQKPTAGGYGFKAALSHSIDRPLTEMNSYAILRKGKSHARKCDMEAVKKQLKESALHRKNIMKEFHTTTDSTNADLRRMRSAYLTAIDHLSNKKVTKKQLVASLQAKQKN